MAEDIDIHLYRGTDVSLVCTATTATNISGWALSLTLKKHYGDATALITKTTAAGITITDDVNGVFTVALSATNTLLEPGLYWADLHRTDAGAITCLASGKVYIDPVARA